MRKTIIAIALLPLMMTLVVSCGRRNEVACVDNVRYEMVFVKAGTFTMGTTDESYTAWNSVCAAHKVTLTQDYYIGRTEVTQELYFAVMGKNPSWHKGRYLPVENVTYDDALEFCQRLSEKTGMTYTLPTSAQWEYAARGGHKMKKKQTKYAGSDDIDEVAWYSGNSDGESHRVATKAPNVLGLYDMTGNVMERCLDWLAEYSEDDRVDLCLTQEANSRVVRGGSFHLDGSMAPVFFMDGISADGQNGNIGFRVVRVL